MRFLFLLFIVVPLLEMLLLIKVGGIIGALPTIALVCLTAAIGVVLIKAQGRATMLKAQQDMAKGSPPAESILDALCLILGGAMLLTPGFVTDSLGFVLLVPALRHALFHKLVAKLMKGGVFTAGFGPQEFQGQQSPFRRDQASNGYQDSNVYQGEYERHEDPLETEKRLDNGGQDNK